MKKLLVAALLFFTVSICFAGQLQKMHMSIIGQEQAAAAGCSWSTIWTESSGADTTHNSTENLRNYITGITPASGAEYDKVRFTFESDNANAGEISHVTVCLVGTFTGGSVYNCAAAPVDILYSGGNEFSWAANSQIVSDELLSSTLSIDGNTDLFVSFWHCESGCSDTTFGTAWVVQQFSAGNHYQSHDGSSSDQSGVQNWGAPNGSTAFVSFLIEIEGCE